MIKQIEGTLSSCVFSPKYTGFNWKVNTRNHSDGVHFNDLVSLFNGISTFVGYLMPKIYSPRRTVMVLFNP